MTVKKRLRVDTVVRYGNRILTNTTFSQDLTIIDDKLDEGNSLTSYVETGTTDKEFDLTLLGISDGKFLFVESNQEISVKLNDSGNTAIPVVPPTDDPTGQISDQSVRVVGMLALQTSNLTKVYVTNASGNRAHVTLFAAGPRA